MEATADTIAVDRRIAIAARPRTAWEYLVDPDKAVRWIGVLADLDPRPGGTYRVEVIPGSVAQGKFVEFDPPHRLVHTWGWEPGSDGSVRPGSTIVKFELIPDGDGTLLRLTHRALPDPAAAVSQAAGWEHYLARLAVAARGFDPGTDPWIERRVR